MGSIPDKTELTTWMRDGKTNAECQQLYRAKGVADVPSSAALSMFRSRHQLAHTRPTYSALLPWTIKAEHKDLYMAKMLRALARRRSGETLPATLGKRLDAWLSRLEEKDAVVHYDARTDEGWHYVDRREDIDLDVIREPHLTDQGQSLS